MSSNHSPWSQIPFKPFLLSPLPFLSSVISPTYRTAELKAPESQTGHNNKHLKEVGNVAFTEAPCSVVRFKLQPHSHRSLGCEIGTGTNTNLSRETINEESGPSQTRSRHCLRISTGRVIWIWQSSLHASEVHPTRSTV